MSLISARRNPGIQESGGGSVKYCFMRLFIDVLDSGIRCKKSQEMKEFLVISNMGYAEHVSRRLLRTEWLFVSRNQLFASYF